jgi:hypothetical protein
MGCRRLFDLAGCTGSHLLMSSRFFYSRFVFALFWFLSLILFAFVLACLLILFAFCVAFCLQLKDFAFQNLESSMRVD